MGPFGDIRPSDHYHFTQIIVDNRGSLLTKDQRKGVPIYAKTAEKSIIDPVNDKIHSSVVHLKVTGYEQPPETILGKLKRGVGKLYNGMRSWASKKQEVVESSYVEQSDPALENIQPPKITVQDD